MPSVIRGFGGNAGIKIGVRGAEKVAAALQKYHRGVERRLHVAMKRSLIMVQAESGRLIAKGYYKPAIDTGRMRNSLTNKITKFNYEFASGEVGTNVYYAIYVHEGHKVWNSTTGTIVPPRPFLVDALKNKKNDILREFKRALLSDTGDFT